ncbi:hemerythrin [Advenella kashmirensis W13003]|uniref:Hemerythrin n=1 Tax=Advenella kashmirensis W13003 TaxID=1424334 RepID=V8QKR2_9BURK|nr:hemerythrin domain-containing protein [Advenella kashmirensis]ETF00521.1 hemerythrin [Advenella kashmirensis W13003]
METIYDALRESHDVQRSLCKRLLRTKPGTGSRDDIFKDLFVELEAHAAAEERFLYAPILMDDNGLSPSRHALAEHHEIEEMLEDLQSEPSNSPGWLAQAKALSKKVHHHLREEEKKFFQASGKILTDTQKTQLARKYRRDFNRMKKVLSEKVT